MAQEKAVRKNTIVMDLTGNRSKQGRIVQKD
jgi:hypothetical protein